MQADNAVGYTPVDPNPPVPRVVSETSPLLDIDRKYGRYDHLCDAHVRLDFEWRLSEVMRIMPLAAVALAMFRACEQVIRASGQSLPDALRFRCGGSSMTNRYDELASPAKV